MNRLLLLFILLIFSFEGNAQRDDMLYGGKSLDSSTDTLANWRIYCNLKQQGIDTEITNIADHSMYLKLTNEGESISGSEIEIHFFNGKQWSYYETGNIFIINRSSTPFEPFETNMKNNVERPKDTPVFGIVKVVVEKDGTVRFPHSTRVHIIPFDERVFPAILRMPKWTPAYLDGKPVRSFYEMVVDIK